MVSEKAPSFKDFSFLHCTSIFTRFGAMSLKSLCFSVDFVCWLAKKYQPQYKNNAKTKVLKAYNFQTKSDSHSVSNFSGLVALVNVDIARNL